MEQLKLDTGVREFRITGGGVLRFNPADPNLYSRFLMGAEQLETLERELTEKGKNATGDEVVALFREADDRIKALLGEVFTGNDFHKALCGVSLLALGGNGKTVAQNLFSALETVLEEGAQKLVDARVEKIREEL